MVRLDSLRNGERFQLPSGPRGTYHGALRSDPLRAKVIWSEGGRRGLLPVGELVVADDPAPEPVAAAAPAATWPPEPGRRYRVDVPIDKNGRFRGKYETVEALCVEPRWPSVRDAADFELSDGRLLAIPSQQVLSCA